MNKCACAKIGRVSKHAQFQLVLNKLTYIFVIHGVGHTITNLSKQIVYHFDDNCDVHPLRLWLDQQFIAPALKSDYRVPTLFVDKCETEIMINLPCIVESNLVDT